MKVIKLQKDRFVIVSDFHAKKYERAGKQVIFSFYEPRFDLFGRTPMSKYATVHTLNRELNILRFKTKELEDHIFNLQRRH